MVKISVKTLKTYCIHAISQLKRGEEPILWLRIEDIEKKLDSKTFLI